MTPESSNIISRLTVALADRYTDRQLMEVVALAGSYMVFAMFNKSLGVPLEATGAPFGRVQ